MLYKKYHRNYIRKFKIGTEFRVYDAHPRKVVRGFLASGGFICIEDNRGTVWDLVQPGGKLFKDIKLKI